MTTTLTPATPQQRQYAYAETVKVDVSEKHIFAAPRLVRDRYSSHHTPLALALNDALGGRWRERDEISDSAFRYDDVGSGLAPRRTGMLRSVTFEPAAFAWMASWVNYGPEAVQPREFAVTIHVQRPFNNGYGGKQ